MTGSDELKAKISEAVRTYIETRFKGAYIESLSRIDYDHIADAAISEMKKMDDRAGSNKVRSIHGGPK